MFVKVLNWKWPLFIMQFSEYTVCSIPNPFSIFLLLKSTTILPYHEWYATQIIFYVHALLKMKWEFWNFGILQGVIFNLKPSHLMSFAFALHYDTRFQVAHWTDMRIQYNSEIFTGMRLIKLYCWEKAFAKLVHQIRRYQLLQFV